MEDLKSKTQRKKGTVKYMKSFNTETSKMIDKIHSSEKKFKYFFESKYFLYYITSSVSSE